MTTILLITSLTILAIWNVHLQICIHQQGIDKDNKLNKYEDELKEIKQQIGYDTTRIYFSTGYLSKPDHSINHRLQLLMDHLKLEIKETERVTVPSKTVLTTKKAAKKGRSRA